MLTAENKLLIIGLAGGFMFFAIVKSIVFDWLKNRRNNSSNNYLLQREFNGYKQAQTQLYQQILNRITMVEARQIELGEEIAKQGELLSFLKDEISEMKRYLLEKWR